MTIILSSRIHVVYKVSHLIQNTWPPFTDLVDYPIHYIHKEKISKTSFEKDADQGLLECLSEQWEYLTQLLVCILAVAPLKTDILICYSLMGKRFQFLKVFSVIYQTWNISIYTF